MDFVSSLPLSPKKKYAIWIETLGLHLDSGANYKKLWVLSYTLAQTDGQSERVIQILENMLRCCILEFEGNWEKYLPLVEFAYNNS
ncbi:Retrotransposon gag protein [Gossypium australe]|uniref:Retrotransposon gag protein n=1 Tax=Gossypium australe TaxID=47621 RepID=A0A5B6UZR5_9ROSI|nr:Retrotransposon gag protein [Gossypium australe]